MGKNLNFFLKSLEEIRPHWLFHAGFGLNFHSGVMYIFNSNSWFWAIIIKGFSEGLPLFKLIFFLKIKKDFNKIDISWVQS